MSKGRPKKIQHPPIEVVHASKTTITLPQPQNLAEALGVPTEQIELKIESINGDEITVEKAIEGIFTEDKSGDYTLSDKTASFDEDQIGKGDVLTLDTSVFDQPETKQLVDKLMEKYLEKVAEPSDINELLPYIYEIAKECETCVEFGVRKPTSTYAFLAAHPKRLVSYDIGRYDAEVTEVEQLCAEVGQNFKFVLADVLQIEIEEADCCLYDTFHTYSQLSKELFLHAPKIKKYMMFHDTISFRYNGQPWTPGVSDFMNCGRGIYPAIEDFLKENPQWEIYREYDFNNGMVILKNMVNEKTFYND